MFFGFSHQIIQIKSLANCIKDQVILIHFGFFNFFLKEDACKNNLVEIKDKDPYSNCTDVILD
jgi:hypothetical protein